MIESYVMHGHFVDQPIHITHLLFIMRLKQLHNIKLKDKNY
jgi:hypothetical protein